MGRRAGHRPVPAVVVPACLRCSLFQRRHSRQMSSPTPAPAQDSGAQSSPQGVSAFAAKVLDQLSLSAWLPAGLLAATLTLLLQFRHQGSADLHAALTAIGDRWLAVLLLALPVLVLGTLTTQAFSYGAIRALEGYWIRRRPAGWLLLILIRWQVRRWKRLKERKRRYARVAFDNAEGRYSSLPAEVVMALRAQAHELSPVALGNTEHRMLFEQLNWRSACDPWDLAKFDDVREAVKEYPERSRIMPTRLGNILRATEDAIVKATDEDLATFALRRRSWLEPRAQLQHDQFRTRLDMYCTLVFVAFIIAGVTILLTIGRDELLAPFAIIAAGFAVLGILAYHAALSSARGYCTMLRMMKEAQTPGSL